MIFKSLRLESFYDFVSIFITGINDITVHDQHEFSKSLDEIRTKPNLYKKSKIAIVDL